MADSEMMSRRSWFRLRPPQPATKPAQPTPPRAATVGEAAPGLSEVAHPPNHDGMDLSELPPMREAVLAAEQVEELFSDIRQLGTDVLLMQRSSRMAPTDVSQADAGQNLEVAKASLLSGRVARVQIRYRWQDSLWIDTLEAKPDGYRIIRIAHAGR